MHHRLGPQFGFLQRYASHPGGGFPGQPAQPRPQTRPDQIKPGQTKTRRGLCRRLTHTHQGTPWLAPQRHWTGRGRVPSLRSLHYTTTPLTTYLQATGLCLFRGSANDTPGGKDPPPWPRPVACNSDCKGQETVCVGGLCPSSDLLGDHCGPVTT
ncbi:hypothetical protein LZ31DRAFT_316317 [Colletotrichum somersetense]|nr:hypothetical protein LZ31DRAFT_316317 [Colletotrichum somersetense]